MDRETFLNALLGTGHGHVSIHTPTPNPGVAQPQCPDCDGPIASMSIEAPIDAGPECVCVCVNGHRWTAPDMRIRAA